MKIEVRQTIPKFYYYITPLFILLDYFGRLSVRAAVLDTTPIYKNLYYGFCIFCAVGIHIRPQLSAVVALLDSTIIVLMTVFSVFLPYIRFLAEADDVFNTNWDIARRIQHSKNREYSPVRVGRDNCIPQQHQHAWNL